MQRPQNTKEAILRLKEAQQRAGHVLTTRKQYRQWMVRYRRAREEKQVRDLQGFLDLLSTQVSPKTVKQALNALVFYHREVLGMTLEGLKTPRVNKNKNIPVCLSHDEVMLLLSHMDGLPRLQAEFLYGTGSRINAMLTMRLKDLDLGKGLVHFRWDKGRKSRTVQLPAAIMPRLSAHLATVRLQWESDHAKGLACPHPDESLMRKLGRRQFTRLPWYWLFPSAEIRGDNRWHATDSALTKAISRAADAAGIAKRVTPHALRHANATALMDRGENIRSIQQHLGHSHLETTEIYTHANGVETMLSPLDSPPVIKPSSTAARVIAFPAAAPITRRA